ncbi:MAG: hypothetical protein QOD38_852, partial [Acidimicrobiaceae bacterium]
VVAVAPSSKPKPSGLVLFLSGGAGTKLWSGTERVDPYFTTLGNDGLEVVQIQWGGEGWLASAPGEQVGPAVLACRSATVIKWAYDTLYTPMGLPAHSDGICGFCVTGNSAGASQTSYAMTHYGLETILDHAVLTSGPPHAALGRGCLGRPGDDAFAYDGGAVGLIDLSYGARDNGPCHRHDASFADQFARDSADGSQGNYTLTHAFVTFIFGDADPSVAPIHADALVKVITPLNPGRVTVVHVPKQPHEITESPDGLAALRKVLTGR